MDKWAMLCKLKVEAFKDYNWRWERKLDGDRIRMDIDGGGKVRLVARSGTDKTEQFPELAHPLYKLAGLPMSIDGEVTSAQGLPFQEFNQRRMNRQKDIAKFAEELPAMFTGFDILLRKGKFLGALPLEERRKALVQSTDTLPLLHTDMWWDDGVMLFRMAVEKLWEGVVGKDVRQQYMPGRRMWVKVKRWLEGEFWVVGFTVGTGKRADRFGSLMLATWDKETCDFTRVAECGTGMDEAELERLDSVRCGLRMELGHVCLAHIPNRAGCSRSG
jgi:bifunctional non-homologous end joining protein LigD